MPPSARETFWNGRPVFLTGATGLLGGWTARALLGAGARVVALVRDRQPHCLLAETGDLDRLILVHGALEDASLILRTLTEYEIDTVIHLAAQPIVGVAKLDPVGTFRANIEGTWNVLDAARRAYVRQTIVASSDKAYGASDNLPYREDHPLHGLYPYDCSKSCADLLAQTYAKTYGMAVSIVRCANLFGGGDLNFNRLVPGAIRSSLHGERFVIRSDGHFVRDYLYVQDAADAYLLLAERLSDGAPQGAYNFSLELQLTVLQLVDRVYQLAGVTHLDPVVLNQASAEIRRQFMSCDKARQLLGWTPQFTLDQGLTATIAWYRHALSMPLLKTSLTTAAKS
jgi:CDP-glucose 4,6-dehydratase